jgi:hypothetical protein
MYSRGVSRRVSLDWTGEGARPHMAGGEANMAGGDPDVSGDPHVRWRPTCPVVTHMSGGDPHAGGEAVWMRVH